MRPDCDICVFLQAKPLQNQLITTNYWTVGIIPDQPYLGRALITLLQHKDSLGQLSDEEWQDFQSIVRKLEPAYEKAFEATPLNIGCFMNHGFKGNPPHPHVHWQVYPRYKKPTEFAGLIFKDDHYGEFYDNDATRPVNNDVVLQILDALKASL